MTADFTRFCISRLASALAAMARILAQPEKDKAVTVTAGHFVGDRAEGTEDPAVVLETGGEDFDQHRFAFEAAFEEGSGWWQPGVVAKGDSRVDRARCMGTNPGSKSRLPGDAESMLTRLLRQTALRAHLKLPGEFPPQIEDVQDRAVLP